MTLAAPAPTGAPPRSGRVLPAAAASPVVDLLTGPLRPAAVLTRRPRLLLLRPAGTDRLLAVTGAGAPGTPHSLQTTVPDLDLGGDAVTVGAGAVAGPGWQVRMARSWNAAVPRVRPSRAAVTALTAQLAAAPGALPAPALRPLTDAVRTADAVDAVDGATITTAAADLVGRGPGSTPAGDDVLCGLWCALIATGLRPPSLPPLDGRTPEMSADLLRLAATGAACREIRALLLALDESARDALALHRALAAVAALGGTSGADLMTGLLLGVTAREEGCR
jgi:hypothetical protein